MESVPDKCSLSSTFSKMGQSYMKPKGLAVLLTEAAINLQSSNPKIQQVEIAHKHGHKHLVSRNFTSHEEWVTRNQHRAAAPVENKTKKKRQNKSASTNRDKFVLFLLNTSVLTVINLWSEQTICVKVLLLNNMDKILNFYFYVIYRSGTFHLGSIELDVEYHALF